uniref:Ovule protein n=1 Tax=Panagrolaimus sp. PS1159 TaxID=55785 RepID=A0AC35F0R4_9BILA
MKYCIMLMESCQDSKHSTIIKLKYVKINEAVLRKKSHQRFFLTKKILNSICLYFFSCDNPTSPVSKKRDDILYRP